MLTSFPHSLLVDESSPEPRLSIILTRESTAINPRTLVFHIARKSLALDSIISMENELSDKLISQSVINAAAREHGLSYSELINKLKIQGVEINRKVLADLAMNDPEKFSSIIKNLKA